MADFKSANLNQYEETYPPNKVLFEEGESGDSFFLIREGKVRVFKEEDDQKLQVGSVSPGEILGEMAVIEDKNVRSASAICYTRVRCIELTKNDFQNLASESKKFRNEVFSLLSRRLSKVDERLWKAKQIEDKIYKAAFLLIYLIDRENWYFQSEEDIKINPSIEALSAFSEIDPPLLKSFYPLLKLRICLITLRRSRIK